MKPAFLLIPTDLAQALASYLATRPYNEVATFIGALVQLQPMPEAPPAPPVAPAPSATDPPPQG